MKRITYYGLSFLLILFSQASLADTSISNNGAKHGLSSLAPMLNKAMPAIVNVAVRGTLPPLQPSMEEKQQRRRSHMLPSKPKPRKFAGLASGVIIDPVKGFILTNAHVVKNSKVITVTLHDGRHFKAKLLGSDPSTDVAV